MLLHVVLMFRKPFSNVLGIDNISGLDYDCVSMISSYPSLMDNIIMLGTTHRKAYLSYAEVNIRVLNIHAFRE